jgi:spore coat protein U-like protein
VTVNCANGTPYSISAVGGNPLCLGNSIVNILTAPTAQPTQSPTYQLFKDAAHTSPLATGSTISCGTTGTPLTGSGVGNAQTLTFYGLVSGSQSGLTPSGNYTDTATVTVTF